MQSAALSEDVQQSADIATLVAEQVLTQQLLATSGVRISDNARDTLLLAGIDPGRFQLLNATALETLVTDDGQVLTLGAIYSEDTARRLWVVIRAWYELSGDIATVSRTELFWNSPEIPEVQLRPVLSGAVPSEPGSVDTYAKSIEKLGEIVAASIDPTGPLPSDVDLVLTFVDRIAFDAQVSFAMSQTGNGPALKTINAIRLDKTGWPIFVISARELRGGFLQVRYRPGSDRDSESSTNSLIASYSLSDLSTQ